MYPALGIRTSPNRQGGPGTLRYRDRLQAACTARSCKGLPLSGLAESRLSAGTWVKRNSYNRPNERKFK